MSASRCCCAIRRVIRTRKKDPKPLGVHITSKPSEISSQHSLATEALKKMGICHVQTNLLSCFGTTHLHYAASFCIH
jgi:hypothetical protein